MPVIAIAPCSKPHDYEEAIAAPAARCASSIAATAPPADVIASSRTGSCCPAAATCCRRSTARPRIPRSSAAEPGRDDYELELARRALEADLPLLAICRGHQVLNVARGGTLVQDIPEQVGTLVNHVAA